jgi:hypothetical protein
MSHQVKVAMRQVILKFSMIPATVVPFEGCQNLGQQLSGSYQEHRQCTCTTN